MLEKRRRVLGLDHRETLTMSGNLALSLLGQDKHAESAKIEREVLVQQTRLLGAEHEYALISASNLAASLWECGKNAECEQLLRETLALSRRALGPNHELTQHVIQSLRAHGLTV